MMSTKKPSETRGPVSPHERFVADVEAQLEEGRRQIQHSKEQIARSKALLDGQKQDPKKG
jgi:hypothetical protein